MSTYHLRAISRHITTNNQDGQAVFTDNTLGRTPPVTDNSKGLLMHFGYGSQQVPAHFENNKDISEYQDLVRNPPGLIIPGGTSARIVDFPPGFTSDMHRTITLNYNFVIEGEVEVILDSGERKVLKQGDMLVQRGVNHAWRNVSETKWAMIAAVATPAEFDRMGQEGIELSYS